MFHKNTFFLSLSYGAANVLFVHQRWGLPHERAQSATTMLAWLFCGNSKTVAQQSETLYKNISNTQGAGYAF